MATRSTISICNDDGSIDKIYCHWDGYIEHNGKILKENFNTKEKIQELIKLGDLSSLAPNVNPASFDHSFDNREDNVCVFYGRDRGEDDVSSQYYASIDDYMMNAQFEEYNYLYRNGVWFVQCEYYFPKFVSLDEAFEIVMAQEAV